MRTSGWSQSLLMIALAIAACTAPALTTQPSLPAPDLVLTEPQTQGSGDAGTIETSLGTFSWQHLTGDIDSLPHPEGDLVITPSGYAGMEHTWDPVTSDVTLDYWHSPNGYEWVSEPFPVPVEPDSAWLEEIGGSYWLTTWAPATLWRSDDGASWMAVPIPAGVGPEVGLMHDTNGTIWLISTSLPGLWRYDNEAWARIDTNAFTLPDIAGVEWGMGSQSPDTEAGPATVGATTLVSWDLGAGVDFKLIGLGDLWGVWDPATRTMGLYADGRTPVRTLSVEAEGNRFIFIDEAGAVVHEIIINDDQLDPATLLDSPDFGSFRQLSLGVLDSEGRITATMPPWGGFGADGDVELLGVDGQFLSFIHRRDQTAATVELWTSPDGLTWSGPQRPGFMPEEGNIDYLSAIRAEGDVVLAELGVGGHTEVWVSDDGVSWADTGLSHDSNVSPWSLKPFGSGGIYIGNTTAGYEMFVSTDLRTWEQVDTGQLGMRPFPENSGGRLLGAYTAGDVIFITLEEDATGTRDMWVLELDR